MAQGTTRRAVLAGVPAVAAVATLPVVAAVAIEPESEIMRLFAEWLALRAASPKYVEAHYDDTDLDEQMEDRFFSRLDEIEAAMIAIPPTTVRELAAIVIAITGFGDLDRAFQNTLEGSAFLPALAEMAGVDRQELPSLT